MTPFIPLHPLPLLPSVHLSSPPTILHPPSPPASPSPPAGCACCHNQGYVGDAWNVFDALVVIGSVVDIILSQVERRQYVPVIPSSRPPTAAALVVSAPSQLSSLPAFRSDFYVFF